MRSGVARPRASSSAAAVRREFSSVAGAPSSTRSASSFLSTRPCSPARSPTGRPQARCSPSARWPCSSSPGRRSCCCSRATSPSCSDTSSSAPTSARSPARSPAITELFPTGVRYSDLSLASALPRQYDAANVDGVVKKFDGAYLVHATSGTIGPRDGRASGRRRRLRFSPARRGARRSRSRVPARTRAGTDPAPRRSPACCSRGAAHPPGDAAAGGSRRTARA
jgi:hypothetical protein